MNKKVLISVKTVQYIDGQPEAVELITEGEYYKEGNDYFAQYEESEISGMEGTKTVMKINNDTLRIVRSGTTTSDLMFKKGTDHISLYNTPFGTLEVMIKPKKVDINVNEDGGNVKLEYKMEAFGLEAIENALELSIKQIN
jgi:uncharacterized beta-barrel protein YwiB (DUF1934 family)